MLVIQPNTFINTLPNTNIWLSVTRLKVHSDKNLLSEDHFHILKCHGKFECLIYKMLFTKEQTPGVVAYFYVAYFYATFLFNELLF